MPVNITEEFVHCIVQSFILYVDKKNLWMYTIVVFTKKQKQEEIILCAMYCGKKRNFYLIRQKH